MTVKRPRANVTFHPDVFRELETASERTGLSISHIVDQLMGAHLAELIAFNDWIERQEGDARELAIEHLKDYGPEDLETAMKRLDPTYQTTEDRMRAEVSETDMAGLFDAKDVADLRAMLDEWKAKRAAKESAQ